jgi:hypothetical protein
MLLWPHRRQQGRTGGRGDTWVCPGYVGCVRGFCHVRLGSVAGGDQSRTAAARRQ